MAAAIVRPSVFDAFQEKPDVALGHLLTFGGHAVASAAALANLKIYREENLVEKGRVQGEYLKSRLEELRAHPTVGDVRGVGLLQAIELVRSKEKKTSWGKKSPFCKRVGELMVERGFITRTWDVMHFAPPLVVTRDEIDTMVTIADEALTIAEREHASEIEA
jgi:adenosylmethionine-8-amino-7-oxononanoate aminotransferase